MSFPKRCNQADKLENALYRVFSIIVTEHAFRCRYYSLNQSRLFSVKPENELRKIVLGHPNTEELFLLNAFWWRLLKYCMPILETSLSFFLKCFIERPTYIQSYVPVENRNWAILVRNFLNTAKHAVSRQLVSQKPAKTVQDYISDLHASLAIARQ